jgi:hypothetical protein
VSILATLTVLFHLRFHRSYNGYLSLLLKNPPWPIISCIFLLWLTSAVISALALVGLGYPLPTGPKWMVISIASGVATALGSAFVEVWLCKRVGFKSWALTAYVALLRVNLAPFHPVAWQLNRLRQRDNLGWQHGIREWDCGVSQVVLSRRIRMLFGSMKPVMAARRRQPEFLSLDAGITPPVQFFLLLDHFGRRGVNELLKDETFPPRPSRDWDGRERRRINGSPEDRRTDPLNPRLIRMGDREILIEDVKRGKVPTYPQ